MMIFQILSAILHFGNVRIKEAEGETSEIPVSIRNNEISVSIRSNKIPVSIRNKEIPVSIRNYEIPLSIRNNHGNSCKY